MGTFLRCLLVLAGLSEAGVPDRAEVDRVVRQLSEAAGFAVRKPVSFQVLSRAEVNRFLDDRIREAVKPAELRAEELTLKKFGFVPPDFDLKKTTLELLTEQTAAFYDYHKKRLFLTDWTSERLRSAAIVHELAHALADQNFPLERFARKVERDSEASAARQAVVEGQANWFMTELLKARPDAEALPEADNPSAVFDRAPLYLRETLTFPYSAGTAFQRAVFLKLGKAGFRYVFEHPPVSTQQVLHPELYFADVRPIAVPLPALRGMKRLVEGPIGELEHAILLRQYTTNEDAERVSPHWRGADYQLWEDRKGGRVSLVYGSVWETEEWGKRYFELYQQVLRAKWKHVRVTEETADRFAGESEEGYFWVKRSGATVISMEGARNPL